MAKENSPLRKGINRGFDPSDATSRKAVESELSEALKKLEHRVEALNSISREQQISGYYELAEAYRKQAAESKSSAQSIRKLLNLGQGGDGLKWPRRNQKPVPDALPHRKEKY